MTLNHWADGAWADGSMEQLAWADLIDWRNQAGTDSPWSDGTVSAPPWVDGTRSNPTWGNE